MSSGLIPLLLKLAFQIGEDATVSHHAVDVERERFDILEICHFKL